MSKEKLEAPKIDASQERELQIEDLGNGLYKCIGVVSVSKYDVEDGIPLECLKGKSTSYVNPCTVQFATSSISLILSGVLDGIGRGLCHSDPNSAARNLMAVKLAAYEDLVIKPRTGLVFIAQNIERSHLRGTARVGIDSTPIEKVLSSGEGFDIARSIIITSQSVEEINKNGIQFNKAWVCFSEEDAEHFLHHVKEKQQFLSNYPEISICCDKKINSLSNRHSIKQGLRQFENEILADNTLDAEFKKNAREKVEGLLKILSNTYFGGVSLLSSGLYEKDVNRRLSAFLDVLKGQLNNHPCLLSRESYLAFDTLKTMEHLCNTKMSRLENHEVKEDYENFKPRPSPSFSLD